MSHIIGGNYGPLRDDLTPIDLQLAGYSIRHCGADGTGFCHWHRLGGGGEMFGICHVAVEDAIADARWLMTGARGQRVLVGLG